MQRVKTPPGATALAGLGRLAFTPVLDVVDAVGDPGTDSPSPAELPLVFHAPAARVYRVRR